MPYSKVAKKVKNEGLPAQLKQKLQGKTNWRVYFQEAEPGQGVLLAPLVQVPAKCACWIVEQLWASDRNLPFFPYSNQLKCLEVIFSLNPHCILGVQGEENCSFKFLSVQIKRSNTHLHLDQTRITKSWTPSSML